MANKNETRGLLAGVERALRPGANRTYGTLLPVSPLMTKPGEGRATMPRWSDFLRRAIKTEPATRGKIAPALVPAFVAAERLRDDQLNEQLRGQGRAPRRTAR